MDTTAISYAKKSRRNINDHFEHIYLGGDWLGRHISPNPHPVTLTEDYKRVIKYISKYLYEHNHYTFKLGGFDRDDIHSLCLTFGHAFFSLEKDRVWTEFRQISSLLQRFIEQRVVAVTNKINSKFQEKEIVAADAHLEENTEDESQSIINYSEEEIEDEGFFPIDSLDEEDIEEEDIDENYYDYMPTSTEVRPRDKQYIASKINEIAKNPDRYASELAHYATSKYVSENIRKAARKICKQYKIDPNQWASKQIEKGASRHEFELEKVK
jgi:hypothetical protein